MDNLSLNGAGGITRRMTDKERIAELERVAKHKDQLLSDVFDIAYTSNCKSCKKIYIKVKG